MISSCITALACLFLLQNAGAVSSIVQLNYSTFQGEALSTGVTQWLGIRYAAPPVGPLRFAAPQPPLANATVQVVTTNPAVCYAVAADPATPNQSEDCLFLSIFAPSHSKPSAHPVYFYIQGGGFNFDGNPGFNGTGLINASDNHIVIVTLNYRVGPYGFLGGQEIVGDPSASLNNGLKDIIFALQWVQSYIAQFGGDPTRVTLGGDSAGTRAIQLILTAYGGRDLGLYHAALGESPAFATILNATEYQYSYNNLVIRTGCVGANNTLECLRSIPSDRFQLQNIATPLPGAQFNPIYFYGPILDYDLIPDLPVRLMAQGKFVKVPLMFGNTPNEGASYAPRTLASYAQTDAFVQAQFPSITLPALAELTKLYPVNGTPTFNGTGAYWRQGGNLYGDIHYICPGLFITAMYRKHGVVNSWNYLFNATDPVQLAQGLGVPHVGELPAVWGPENLLNGGPASFYPGGVNAAVVPVVQRYWTSFVRSRNPNTYRLNGQVEWVRWTNDDPQRLVIATNNTVNKEVGQDQLSKCAYWQQIAVTDLNQ